MKYSIHWTDRAVAGLYSIKEFMSQVSPDKAERVTRELVIHARELLTFPLMGVKDERIGNDNLRKLIKGRHFLIYEIRGNRIEILDAFSTKQDFQARFIHK